MSCCLFSSSVLFILTLPFPFIMSGEEEDERLGGGGEKDKRRGCGNMVIVVVGEEDDWWDGGEATGRTCEWRPWGGGIQPIAEIPIPRQ